MAGKINKEILKWRQKQRPHAIMSPETFEEIKKRAKKAGASNPEAVAGHAYWQTVKAKYRARKK